MDVLGRAWPIGIMILTTLQHNGSLPGDLYQQFVGKLKFYLRVPLELCSFVLVWIVAYQTMILISNLSIMYESVITGRTIAEIIGIQNGSSGMWAFSEELEVRYLMVLFYLLWPICFNAICRPPKLWASAKGLICPPALHRYCVAVPTGEAPSFGASLCSGLYETDASRYLAYCY